MNHYFHKDQENNITKKHKMTYPPWNQQLAPKKWWDWKMIHLLSGPGEFAKTFAVRFGKGMNAHAIHFIQIWPFKGEESSSDSPRICKKIGGTSWLAWVGNSGKWRFIGGLHKNEQIIISLLVGGGYPQDMLWIITRWAPTSHK